MRLPTRWRTANVWAQFEPEMFAHHEDRIAAAIEARYGIDVGAEAEELRGAAYRERARERQAEQARDEELARERNVERDDEAGAGIVIGGGAQDAALDQTEMEQGEIVGHGTGDELMLSTRRPPMLSTTPTHVAPRSPKEPQREEQTRRPSRVELSPRTQMVDQADRPQLDPARQCHWDGHRLHRARVSTLSGRIGAPQMHRRAARSLDRDP